MDRLCATCTGSNAAVESCAEWPDPNVRHRVIRRTVWPIDSEPTGKSRATCPLAYLIENPDQTDGAPPFALTDQTGTIQRYVEPVPGIDLAPYVGQVVVVRNDTGPTLLASQLELPPQPLYPMVGERGYSRPAGGPSFMPPRRSANRRRSRTGTVRRQRRCVGPIAAG